MESISGLKHMWRRPLPASLMFHLVLGLTILSPFVVSYFLIIGPVCNVSGYSEHARMFADAFLEDDNFDTYIIATQWANATTDMRHEKKYIDRS